MASSSTTISLPPKRHPLLSLLLLLALVHVGASLGQQIAFAWLEASEIGRPTMEDLPSRTQLIVLQACVSSTSFIVAPLFYQLVWLKQPIRHLFRWSQGYLWPLLLTLGWILVCMVINTLFIQWNQALQLPPWLHHFEVWAQQLEDMLNALTRILISFPSYTAFLSGLLVVGILPAIGEELLFRGLLQPLFHQLVRNIHIAVGLSAFVFSVIHGQIHGLLPRFFLGLLFGYLYHWTQDLCFPMVAHFVNNACTLLLYFVAQQRGTTHYLENIKAPSWPILTLCAFLASFLGWLLYLRTKVARGNEWQL